MLAAARHAMPAAPVRNCAGVSHESSWGLTFCLSFILCHEIPVSCLGLLDDRIKDWAFHARELGSCSFKWPVAIVPRHQEKYVIISVFSNRCFYQNSIRRWAQDWTSSAQERSQELRANTESRSGAFKLVMLCDRGLRSLYLWNFGTTGSGTPAPPARGL